MNDTPRFTISEKLAEAKREVALRKAVYPGLIARKKMRQGEADRHLEIMRDIVTDYERALARQTGESDGTETT